MPRPFNLGARQGRSDHGPPGRTIIGTDGPDTLTGGAGPDFIDGGRGDDVLRGGRGDDTIHGGMGADTMTGGDGADTFTFGSPWTTAATAPPMWDGGGVTDFEPGEDKLDFSNLISDKGYDGTFLGTAPFSTNPPFPRDPNSYQYTRGDFDSVEVRYAHSRLADGSPVTTVLFDGPVYIGSARFNPTPMDGNVDIQMNLPGHLTLAARDFIL
jgi:hypothetical protein